MKCFWQAVLSFLLILLLASAAAAQRQPAPEAGPRISRPQIAGGYADVGNTATDVVVRLTGNVTCSGTLVTPMAVLTARHCVNGSDKAGGFVPPIFVQIGYDNQNFIQTYTSNNILTSQAWAPGPQTTGDWGNDVAMVYLDPPVTPGLGVVQYMPSGTVLPKLANYAPGPAWNYAQIIHPSFASPCPTSGCNDADGGTYSPPLGMAGWAPEEAPRYRQVAYDTQFNHYPGKPDDRGQYWQHPQGAIHVDAGDSGGPLFVWREVPGHPGQSYRDVIGVLSGYDHEFGGNDHDYWADVTRGAIADWVRAALADPIPRGPNWRKAHPNLVWIGDVDYTGPCQVAQDKDCDHIYDVHDNCPAVFNPDQRDTLDNGIGDACRNLPQPPPKPFCTAHYSCYGFSGATTVSCPYGIKNLDLYRVGDDGQLVQTNANTTQGINDFIDYYSAAPGTNVMYYVIQQYPYVSSDPLTVTTIDCACHPENDCPIDAQCGSASDGCGGSDICGGSCAHGNRCSSNHCCPTGKVWNTVFRMCAKTASCPKGEGDCGGYCCHCTPGRCQ